MGRDLMGDLPIPAKDDRPVGVEAIRKIESLRIIDKPDYPRNFKGFLKFLETVSQI
jgi:hypothetical protein